MSRILAIAALAFLVSPALADLIPPGTKNLAIDTKIYTDKDYSEWVFFILGGDGTVKPVKLDTNKALTIPGSSGVGNGPVPDPDAKPRTRPYRSNLLVAVPKDAVKKYATEKELHAALDDGKVPGDHDNVKVTDPRKNIVNRFKLVKIDAKDGIVLEVLKEDVKPEPEVDSDPQAAMPKVFSWWMMGGLMSVFLIFTGLRLFRRRNPRLT